MCEVLPKYPQCDCEILFWRSPAVCDPNSLHVHGVERAWEDHPHVHACKWYHLSSYHCLWSFFLCSGTKPKTSQGSWTRQYVWNSERHSPERRRLSQKAPSKTPLFLRKVPDVLEIGHLPWLRRHIFQFKCPSWVSKRINGELGASRP